MSRKKSWKRRQAEKLIRVEQEQRERAGKEPLQLGDRVCHPTHGMGTLLGIYAGDDALVIFDQNKTTGRLSGEGHWVTYSLLKRA
jgi:hypothetical protein